MCNYAEGGKTGQGKRITNQTAKSVKLCPPNGELKVSPAFSKAVGFNEGRALLSPSAEGEILFLRSAPQGVNFLPKAEKSGRPAREGVHLLYNL